MIPRECKRLAEVDFPIAEVSKHAAREKDSRCGHIPKVHIWPAARPTASSRAVLMALLLPDPCDPHCPDAFKNEARQILLSMYLRPEGWTTGVESDQGLRRVILKFIAEFANWDRATDRTYLDVSRALVQAAHGEEPPLVVDPFAGGGSIPLEALRLGCEAFASDLNPVACLILKVVLEDIPRHGPELADELRKVGAEIKRQAERELADLYPVDPGGATPIAYLWARTVRCEAPNCGAEIPLMRSFWLCNKSKRKWALRHRVERPAGAPARVEFEVFKPKADREVHGGTVTRAKATCLCCGAVLPPERVRAQLAAQRGGADVVFDDAGQRTGGARMTAVVTLRPGQFGRHYRLPRPKFRRLETHRQFLRPQTGPRRLKQIRLRCRIPLGGDCAHFDRSGRAHVESPSSQRWCVFLRYLRLYDEARIQELLHRLQSPLLDPSVPRQVATVTLRRMLQRSFPALREALHCASPSFLRRLRPLRPAWSQTLPATAVATDQARLQEAESGRRRLPVGRLKLPPLAQAHSPVGPSGACG